MACPVGISGERSRPSDVQAQQDRPGRAPLGGAGVDIADGALFRSVNKAGATGGRLDVRSVRRIIQRRAADAGVTDRVNGHSLRVGAPPPHASMPVPLGGAR